MASVLQNEHAASHALCGLYTPRQIANGVCTIEQVKLAASVWFSKDERCWVLFYLAARLGVL